MEKNSEACLAILVLIVSLAPPKALSTDPSLDDLTGTDSSDWTGPSSSTAATTADSLVISYPFQRKIFYANGLFWVFYDVRYDTYYYKTSKDGISWSDGATSLGWPTGSWSGEMFSTVFDGTYFHYAYALSVSSGNALKYRRGTPNSDGTITWSAAEQTAVAGSSGITISTPYIVLDSDGYPWIGYRRDDGTNRYPYVTRSSTKDGTWTTASGFPVRVSFFTASGTISVPTPLTGGKMFCLYTSSGFQVKGRSCDGSGNLGPEVHTTNYIQGSHMSVIGQGDYVHLVFSDNYVIRYTKYNYSSNSFGTNSTVVSSTQAITNLAPVLTIDTARNDIYCFYAGYPSANHIYYKILFSSNGSWSSATDWISETTDGLTDNNRITGFYQDYSRKIGLVYLTKASSPYNVRLRYLDGSYDIAGKTGVMGLQAGNDEDSFALAIKLDYPLIGFRTSGMALGDKYEVNFTIGSMDFSMLFVATAASRGEFALCYKSGGTWTTAETIDKTSSDITSGTRYESGTGNTAFKLTDSTSSSYGYVKLEVSRSYLTSLGASGDTVTNIVGRTYLASSTTTFLPGPQGGTNADRCPSGSSTASYTMKKIPEFPLGVLILAMPLMAIYLFLRRSSAKWRAA